MLLGRNDERASRTLCATALALCVGCGSTAPAPTPPPQVDLAVTPPPPAAPSSRSLFDADWGWLRADGFGVELMVPERAAWSGRQRERWFVAQHAPSGAELSVRTWSARRTVSRAECERELFYSQKGLAQGAAGELLAEHAVSAPDGFDVWVRLWVEGASQGIALAVGAGPGECYAAVFRARGDEGKLGGELRLAADGILSRARLVGVEAQRAPRPTPAF